MIADPEGSAQDIVTRVVAKKFFVVVDIVDAVLSEAASKPIVGYKSRELGGSS